MQQALGLPRSWLYCQAQPPFPTASYGDEWGKSGVTPFSDFFRAPGDSQERRYGAISSCHGGERGHMDTWISPSPSPFPLVSICPSLLFCRVNWEKWVWMALMEKRSVILIAFLFVTRCSSDRAPTVTNILLKYLYFAGRQGFARLLWREGILRKEGRLFSHLQLG